MNKPILCLMGPTAAGKTDLALSLAEHIPLEIISVDSAMVYRGMNIGTAKPSSEVQSKIPHHLIDLCEPHEPYSCARFVNDCHIAIQGVLERERIPLLVGGTMLYYKAFQFGLAELPEASPAIREQITALAAEKGWPGVHQALAKIDPQSASRIHPNDVQRLQRAIEVYELTGQPMSSIIERSKQLSTRSRFINIAIAPSERAMLHERIAKRFDLMLEQGFIEEVQSLYKRSKIHADLPSMRSVGYRQVIEYLESKINYAQMREKGIIATRQLAKRQLTWLRHWDDLTWIMSNKSKNCHLVEQIVALLHPL